MKRFKSQSSGYISVELLFKSEHGFFNLEELVHSV